MVYDITLGALLHDIGKLYMKGGENGATVAGLKIVSDHPLISAEFIDKHKGVISKHGFNVALVKEIVQRHHSNTGMNQDCLVQYATSENKKMCELVSTADSCSSNERVSGIEIKKEIGSGKSYRTATLHSVFSAISEDEKLYGYSVGRYTKQIDKPSELQRVNSFEKSIEFISKFDKEFDEIDESSKLGFINSVNELLSEYAWCFPSASNEVFKDVSLYDHLKTTAAIANSMYSNGKKNSQAYIIEIRINGADKFIAKSTENGNILTLDTAKKNAELVRNSIQSIIEDAEDEKYGIEITDCNIIYENTLSVAFMIRKNQLDKLLEIVQKQNNRLIGLSGLNCYIEARYIEIELKAGRDDGLMKSNQLVGQIRKSFNSYTPEVEEYSLKDILTDSKSNTWIDKTPYNSSLSSNNTIGHTITTSKLENRDSKVYAVVKLTVTNLDETLDRLFKISKNRILSWGTGSTNNGEDELLEYGSISRVCNIYRNINTLLSVNNWLNVINISREDDTIAFIIGFDDLVFKFGEYLNTINKTTLNNFNITATIQTFLSSEDVESVYRRVSITHTKLLNQDKPIISYNGQRVAQGTITNLGKYVNIIRESKKLNTSQLYKLAEFIRKYKEDKTKHRAQMSIPRYFNNKYKNYNSKTIDTRLEEFYTKEFTKLLNGQNVTQIFVISDTLILDSIR